MSHEIDNTDCLSWCRLLIVEGEYYVAEDLARTLRSRGATVVGPAPALASARSLLRALHPHCVLLNIQLGGENTIDFALELLAADVPAIFITGYDAARLPKAAAEIPLLRKPVLTSALVQLIQAQRSCYEKR